VKCTVLQVSLGGHQWLFSVPVKADVVPAVCLRHDVDGCLWQFESPQEDGHWPCTHIGTFLAFGYVQASKQQKKFCTSSPGTFQTSSVLLNRFTSVVSYSKTIMIINVVDLNVIYVMYHIFRFCILKNLIKFNFCCHLGDIGIDGRIILEFISEKRVVEDVN
jgi:hypothetical protein